jgi:hypothetical protein
MRPAACALLLFLAGCNGSATDTSSQPCDPCVLGEENNYSYTPHIEARSYEVASHEDIRISWAELQHDLLGHDLDPADLDLATLLVFGSLTQEQVLDDLGHDRLDQSDLEIGLTCSPTDESCALSEFGLLGNKLDVQTYLVPGSGTWLVIPGRQGQAGAASMVFLDPNDKTPPAEVLSIPEGSATLTVDVDLSSLTPLTVENGASPALDWSGLTLDALGNAISLSRFDRLLLKRFDLDIPAIEDQFLDLEVLPGDSWEADIGGLTTFDLSELEDFGGLEPTGAWLLAVQCSTCTNPAPRFLTVFKVLD